MRANIEKRIVCIWPGCQEISPVPFGGNEQICPADSERLLNCTDSQEALAVVWQGLVASKNEEMGIMAGSTHLPRRATGTAHPSSGAPDSVKRQPGSGGRAVLASM